MYPMTRDLQIAAGYAELAHIDRTQQSLYNDPMSVGAPLEDFADDFDVRRRQVIGRIAKRADKIGDQAAREFANSAFERWMP